MSSNNTGENQSTFLSSTTLTILSALAVAVFVYPAVSQLARGEPIGGGVSTLLVGGLLMGLIVGLRGIDWVGATAPLSDSQDRVAVLTLLGIVIGGSLLILVYFPDTPAAIGLLLLAIQQHSSSSVTSSRS